MTRTTRLAAVVAASSLALTALTACGGSDKPTGGGSGSAAGSPCLGQAGNTTPKKLVLALVPSGDAKKLVQSVKPLTAALTKSLGIPVTAS